MGLNSTCRAKVLNICSDWCLQVIDTNMTFDVKEFVSLQGERLFKTRPWKQVIVG
jgi:hypothetical protein